MSTIGSGYKVLVIDDSNTIRRSAEIFLKQGGHEVLLAEDGYDALSKVTTTAAPDLLRHPDAAPGRLPDLRHQSSARQFLESAVVSCRPRTACSTRHAAAWSAPRNTTSLLPRISCCRPFSSRRSQAEVQ